MRGVEILDNNSLQHVVEADQDCLHVNSQTNEVVSNVIRNLTKDREIFQWLDNRARFNIRTQRDARVSNQIRILIGNLTTIIEA